jgi:thiamine biosynthesis lipoprotein
VTTDRKRLAFQLAALLVVILLIVVFATRRRETSESSVEHRIAMGTLVSVTVSAPDARVRDAAMAAAFAEVDRVDSLTSRYFEGSDISRLNESAGGYAEQRVDPEVADIISASLAISKATDGAFDITIAPVVELWSVDEEGFEPPSPEAVARGLAHVDWRAVRVDTAACTVSAPPGTRLDLAGIAKGYAVDRAVSALLRAGVTTGVVDAGGDVGFAGTPPHPEGWYAGVQRPRGEGLLGVLLLDGGSVATSGDYQHYAIVDGVRYHHLLDPSTGYPARGVMSVTVAADHAITADALATAIFVMGAEKGMAFVERTPGVEALIVTGDGDDEGEILLSSGLEGRFTDTKDWRVEREGASEER